MTVTFLNKVCTHIADLDFSKIQIYVGNYDFWYESSQLSIKNGVKMRIRKKKKKLKSYKRLLLDLVQMHLNQNKRLLVKNY